jgi:flagellar biosynthesis/type III secretory pathway ATPase
MLEEKLQDALHQMDTLTRINKALEELQLAAAEREVGRRDTVPGHFEGGECLALGDYHTKCWS